jgi:prepilin-type N-terminal cleavage/methylation domain-containing protein
MNKTISHLKQNAVNSISRGKEQGFSLPEIIIAIVILGVIAAIAIPAFVNQQKTVANTELDQQLIDYSIIVENERGLNNGVYPNYTPRDIANSSTSATVQYTYSENQLVYCIKAVDVVNGVTVTKYIGSPSNGKVTTTTCWQAKTGGVQPGDDSDENLTPVNNHNPVITSINPTSVKSRSGGVTITVNGKDFLNGASVLYDGEAIVANVLNSSKITFVTPASSTYHVATVQVKNPSGRTSDEVNFSLINPIIGTTAPEPETITNNSASGGANVTSTVSAISCPSGATAQYSFKLVRYNDTYSETPNNTIKDATDGSTFGTWSTNRNAVVVAPDGYRFGFKAQARCTLEGEYGNVSAWTEEGRFNVLIANPAAPTVRSTFSPATPMANHDTVTHRWNNMSCPARTEPDYRFYKAGTTVIKAGGDPVHTTTRTVAGTDTYTYDYRCVGPYNTSNWSAKAPSTTVTTVAEPAMPARVTNLRETNNAGVTASVAWNPINCNIGTEQYQFQYVSPSTSAGPWQTATTFTTSAGSLDQAATYTWRVNARCVYDGVISDVSTSANDAFKTIVIKPKGSFNTTTVDDFVISNSSSSLACTDGAALQYQGVRTLLDNNDGISNKFGWHASESSTMNGNYGSRQRAYHEARCVANSTASEIVEGGEKQWVVSIPRPGQAVPLTHNKDGNNRYDYWRAVQCPAGTFDEYSYYAHFDDGRMVINTWNVRGAQVVRRNSIGDNWYNSKVSTRCVSDFYTMGYGSLAGDRYWDNY